MLPKGQNSINRLSEVNATLFRERKYSFFIARYLMPIILQIIIARTLETQELQDGRVVTGTAAKIKNPISST